MFSHKHQRSPHPSVGPARTVTNFSAQHLLYDKGLTKRLVALIGDADLGVVIDIGAGTGALTVPLAERSDSVLAVESDPVLAAKLRKRLTGIGNVRVIRQDFLRMPLPRGTFRVVSNIPFSITTPILGKLMDRPTSGFQEGIIIVESGAAIRFTREPITNPRILVWRTWFDLDIVETLPAACFSPPPRVDAAVLRVRRKDPPPVPPQARDTYMSLVTECLRIPQLTALRALSGVFTAEQVKRLTRRLQVDRNTPVCRLSVHDWTVVYETMCRYVDPHRWPRPAGRARLV